MTSQTALAIVLTVVALLLLDGSPSAVQGGTDGRIFTVDTTADNDTNSDPTCSLREAIKASNMGANYNGCVGQSNPGTDDDRIQFALGPGNPTINVAANLDAIVTPVVIDGATGGATRVVLHGPGQGEKGSGLVIYFGANGSRVLNLVINNFEVDGNPLLIYADNVRVAGNFIGTNADGTSAVPNRHGLRVEGDNARIGGTHGLTVTEACTGDCNLLSGNQQSGLDLAVGTGIVVEGNFIGTDVTGTNAIPNGDGVATQSVGAYIGTIGAGNLISGNLTGITVAAKTYIQGNLIGTDAAGTAAVPNETGIYMGSLSDQSVVGPGGAGNIISGNLTNGIATRGSSSITIAGNRIGTDINGTDPLPNGEVGVLLESTQFSLIGGTGLEQANVIAFNGREGIRVSDVQSFYIQMLHNSISANQLKGIEIDPGSNTDIVPPVILSADATHASGTTGAPHCVGSPCGVEVYSDSEDEGRTYEGSTLVDSNGEWTFNGPLSGPNITATATDDGGDTSEFSSPFSLLPPSPTPSPTPTLSPTPTVTPTATPTSTNSGTATPTTAPFQVAWGDHNCSGNVDLVDAILNIRYAASLPTDTGDCPEMGAGVDIGNATLNKWGDFDCNGIVNTMDGLGVLLFFAEFTVPSAPQCPDPGETVSIS
ncbi:MAG: CSLREA domain-containing protein [Chloroflexota bacterium]